MPSLDSSSIVSYLPALVVRRFTTDMTPLTGPVSEEFPAAAFFADISGFTTLAEQLAEHNAAGAEELSALLKDYFGRLINLITAHGGDVVKFAGDALLALWPAGQDEDLSVVTRRAAQCGLAVQAALHRYETTQGARLSLRIGVGAGQVRAIYVGGVYQRWELLVSGQPLVEMSLAQQQAQPGEIVLSSAAWEQVQDTSQGQKLPSGDVRLEAIHTPLPLRPLTLPDIPAAATQALQGYLPGAILARLSAGQSAWLAELRPATVIFVSLPGLNHTTPLDEAQALMQALQKNIYRYEGSINKLNVDDKGVTLVAALGLPPWSHEDDAVRGVQAASDISETLRTLGWRCAIGVASGRTFCGSVGNEQRREYTLLGDMVNLAARLMQAAVTDQDILCDANTYRAASARLAFETLPPIMVKGKAEPVSIYRPSQTLTAQRKGQGQAQIPGNLRPMVGREKERAALDSALQSLQDGESRQVVIEGEAGIGKSRLVAELLALAQAKGISVLSGAGDAIEKSTPYHAWRPVFSQLFSLDPLSNAEQQRAQALAQLESIPEAPRLAPLLNVILPLDFPESDLTAQMTGQVRAENTRDLLLGLLQTAASAAPTLLVLEDVHWLDSSSWALALAIAQQVQPLLLALATRPLSVPVPLEYSQLLGLPSAQLLQLEALPPDELLRLVCQRLGVTSLPDEVIQLIQEKAEGHPFFSEELAYALRDAGLITLVNGECRVAPNVDLRSLSFPETVQGVITSRIDRLTPQQQLALKAASVIGRVFALRILRHVHPIEADRPRLAEYLAGMERLDITPLETPAPDLTYIFKHAITQDVAYNLMLFSQRRELHQLVAEWYEENFADDLDPYYPLLAHHWSRAIEGMQRPEPALVAKALDCLEKAGEAALHGYANQEAIRFFGEALRLDAEQLQRTPALRRARWERQLAEADLRMGALTESGEHFRRALVLLGQPVSKSDIGSATGLISQFVLQVLHRFFPARFAGKKRERSVIFLEAAGAYLRLGEVYYYHNQIIQAMETAFRAVNLAESVGPASPELARAYANICFSGALLGMQGPAEAYSRLALGAARGQDDLPALAHVLMVTSIYKSHIANWTETLPAVEQAMQINERLGERRWWAEDLLLLGLTSYYRGEFTRGLQLMTEALSLSRQLNNVQQLPWHLLGQAHGLIRLGRADEALPPLEEALVISEQVTDLRVKINCYALLALARLHRGEAPQARAAAAQAAQWIAKATTDVTYAFEGYADVAEVTLVLWEAAASQGQATSELRAAARQACKAMHKFAGIYPIGQSRDLLWQGLYDWLDGKPAHAYQSWQKSLERAVQLSMPYDEALAHREIGRHLPAEAPARREHLARAKEIFAELGAGYDLARVDE